ncbi:MAG: 1-acyl-sn-glycerol-3-phosphate acyltransferase [Muribaculaceae bacterium]|nr:1-acyl-sn-glycerol-3-phosphate acyltransferase [Muribaculaceae bacterium]
MDNFEDIRPYTPEEIPAAIEELMAEEYFRKALAYVTPDVNGFLQKMPLVKDTDQFQQDMLFPVIKWLMGIVSDGVQGSGFSYIDNNKGYTYISNHRDILTDALFLGFLLRTNGLKSPEMALGDNLLVYPWMRILVRLCKGIIVYRNLPLKRTLEEASRLSGYINQTISENNNSVWIAQREGRTKDSDDRTQESVLKMLSFAGKEDMRGNVKALNITPVSISYEYDACDYLKAREFQFKRDNAEFKKTPKDDLNSMAVGLMSRKGKVNFVITEPINDKVDALPESLTKAEFYTAVAKIVDEAIHQGYVLYPINYAAYDLLKGTDMFADKYTAEEKEKFSMYVDGQIAKIKDLPNPDNNFLREKILEMYSNPLKNKLKLD